MTDRVINKRDAKKTKSEPGINPGSLFRLDVRAGASAGTPISVGVSSDEAVAVSGAY
jgi:hypothetical protein